MFYRTLICIEKILRFFGEPSKGFQVFLEFASISPPPGCGEELSMPAGGSKQITRNKKENIRPNLGGSLRPHAEAPRHRFLYTDVTTAEHEEIRQYCVERQISISQFLAELVLNDAAKSKSRRKQKVIVKAEIELSAEEQDKLELLTRLHQKESVSEFIREILQPNLQVQRLHAPLETKSLRFYLSEEEHERVTRHIGGTGISARNYAAMLALREIGKNRKKKRSP